MPAMAALAALALVFVAVVLRTLARSARARLLAVTVALLVPAAGVAQLAHHSSRASLATFADTDAFDDPLLRQLPARAVVVAHGPQTVFRLWGALATERARPDVTIVPMPFLPYPGMVEALVTAAPELRSMLGGYVLEGELRQPDLQSLAATRPLLVELDPRVPPSLYETLVPHGLYHEVLADGATDGDVRLGARAAQETWARLYSLLPHELADLETRSQLLWRHYVEALYYAGVGARELALEAVARGLAINAEAHELVALHVALQEPGDGPLDVRPFTVTLPSGADPGSR
jgi:hypothetical protein